MVQNSQGYHRYRPYGPTLKILLILALLFNLDSTLLSYNITVFSNNNRKLIQLTHRIALEQTSRLTFFKLPDTSQVNIFIANSPREFDNLVGTKLPQWIGAVTICHKEIIVIKSPALSHTSIFQYQTTLYHEIVHLLHCKTVPLNLSPRWFNEGLAIYFSERINWSRRLILSKVILNNQLYNLMYLDSWFDLPEESAEIAYTLSAAAIEFIVKVYGIEAIAQIFNCLRQGESFHTCLEKVIGEDYSDFSDMFIHYVKTRYAWVTLSELQYLFWLFLSLLVVIIYLRIRRKRKLAFETMESEQDKETGEHEPPQENSPNSFDH